ncbi:DUF1134 domain-containing protein [Propylenella binzhouense]|uniref:DUF1134 domain-containing protein n=1 Tax=Propylenella binzhouense TaxID=2555902 RepID=A0A964T5S7_9HYPH|nr:DUF1134 domain-containing protein [Propylenella binzhouense]MYZ49051.1 DUF1134 domain-containing protein [Propylenella binzhouense]
MRTRAPGCWLLLGLIAAGIAPLPAGAQPAGAPVYQQQSENYTAAEIVSAGHKLFGQASGELAALVERAVSKFGLPNGYIIGEEASGAVFGGLRYGEGTLYTKMDPERHVFWQGPSVGWDLGGDGNRTMMLVYDLPTADSLFRRYGGVAGSAYLVGGLGMTVLANTTSGEQPIYLVPIRTGVGARLGINIGYLKFTPQATWNPF